MRILSIPISEIEAVADEATVTPLGGLGESAHYNILDINVLTDTREGRLERRERLFRSVKNNYLGRSR